MTTNLQNFEGTSWSYNQLWYSNRCVDQKIGVLLAGGEYADLMGTTDLNIRLITGGALIPLDDYLTGIKPICFLNM